MQPKPKKRFNVHSAIIKVALYQPKKVRLDEIWVSSLFSIAILDLQRSMLCITWQQMLSWQCRNLLMSTQSLNCGESLFPLKIVKNKIPKYIKLVELAIVQVIGSIKNKHFFFYFDLHDNKIMEPINHAFGACHSHVQVEVLHFLKLSFWNNYSKLGRQQNLVWCKKLKLELIYQLASCFFLCILIIPISFLFLFFFFDIWIFG